MPIPFTVTPDALNKEMEDLFKRLHGAGVGFWKNPFGFPRTDFYNSALVVTHVKAAKDVADYESWHIHRAKDEMYVQIDFPVKIDGSVSFMFKEPKAELFRTTFTDLNELMTAVRKAIGLMDVKPAGNASLPKRLREADEV